MYARPLRPEAAAVDEHAQAAGVDADGAALAGGACLVAGRLEGLTVPPDDLKAAIDEHPEINWSEVARQSMWEYLQKLQVANEIVDRSELTEAGAAELSADLKRDIAERYRSDE